MFHDYMWCTQCFIISMLSFSDIKNGKFFFYFKIKSILRYCKFFLFQEK